MVEMLRTIEDVNCGMGYVAFRDSGMDVEKRGVLGGDSSLSHLK